MIEPEFEGDYIQRLENENRQLRNQLILLNKTNATGTYCPKCQEHKVSLKSKKLQICSCGTSTLMES